MSTSIPLHLYDVYRHVYHMSNQQNGLTLTAAKQTGRRRECPACDKTIQVAYSDYCIGCMQELRTILSMSKGVRC